MDLCEAQMGITAILSQLERDTGCLVTSLSIVDNPKANVTSLDSRAKSFVCSQGGKYVDIHLKDAPVPGAGWVAFR